MTERPATRDVHLRVDSIAEGPSLWVTTTLGGEGPASVGACRRHEWDVDAFEHRSARLRCVVDRANREGAVDLESKGEMARLGALLFDDLFPTELKRRLRELDGGFLTLGLTASLWHVPFELLHDGRGVLARRWAMGRQLLLDGLATPPRTRRAAPRARLLVLADPDGSLPECYNEGVVVRRLLEHAEHADVAFHSTRVGRDLVREELRDFDLVHIAGHLDDDGLRVADGRFGPDDVTGLAGGLPMPRLVVLNGCASGDGATLRSGSLAGRLLEAGVEHLVGALFEVPDPLARDLAIAFWSELGRGCAVGEALRRARVTLAELHDEATATWAAYALFGRPETVYSLGAAAGDGRPDPDVPILTDRQPRAPEVAELGAATTVPTRLRAPAASVLAEAALSQPRWLTQTLALTTVGLLLAVIALLVPRLLHETPPREARGRVVDEPAEVASVAERPVSMLLLNDTDPLPGSRLRLSLGLQEPAFVELLRVSEGRVERLWPDLTDDGWLTGGRHLLPPAATWQPDATSRGESVLVVRRTSPLDDPEALVIYLNTLLATLPSEAATHEDSVVVVETVLAREGAVVDRVEY